MARATWVECEVGALWKIIRSTTACINGGQPVLLELSCLISKPDIVLCALVLAQIAIIGAVSKPDCGTIGELEALIALVVGSNAMQHG